LPCPCLKSEGCTCKACVVSESSNTSTSVVDEEFEIKEGTTAAGEAGEDLFPAALLLIAMCELDVDVLEGNCIAVRKCSS